MGFLHSLLLVLQLVLFILCGDNEIVNNHRRTITTHEQDHHDIKSTTKDDPNEIHIPVMFDFLALGVFVLAVACAVKVFHRRKTPEDEEPRRCSPDVFLVHAGTEKLTEVSTLKNILSSDLCCFLDKDDLHWTNGDAPRRMMQNALETCRYGVAVVSKVFLTRKDPCEELAYLHQRLEWLREHGYSWQSLCVILCNITFEEYKDLCQSAPIDLPLEFWSALTVVKWDKDNQQGICWDDVCTKVKKDILRHDQQESGAFRKWKRFLEEQSGFSSFPRAGHLFSSVQDNVQQDRSRSELELQPESSGGPYFDDDCVVQHISEKESQPMADERTIIEPV